MRRINGLSSGLLLDLTFWVFVETTIRSLKVSETFRRGLMYGVIGFGVCRVRAQGRRIGLRTSKLPGRRVWGLRRLGVSRVPRGGGFRWP